MRQTAGWRAGAQWKRHRAEALGGTNRGQWSIRAGLASRSWDIHPFSVITSKDSTPGRLLFSGPYFRLNLLFRSVCNNRQGS